MSVLISLVKCLLSLITTQSNIAKSVIALAIITLYRYRSHAIGTRRRQDLKQPKGAWPLLGHLPLLASVSRIEIHQFFEKLNSELGPVWSISLPGLGRLIEIDTPENLQHVLKDNFWGYERGPVFRKIMFELVGSGIGSSEGAEWKFYRQLVTKIFTIKAFREYTSDIFVIHAKQVVEYLGKAADDGTAVDFQALMMHYTLDCFGAVSFGKSFGYLESNEHDIPFVAALDALVNTCANRIFDPLWKFRERLTAKGMKVKQDRKTLHAFVHQIIQRRKKEGYHSEKDDLLQLLLESSDDKGSRLAEEEVINNIITLMVAASETTATALTWMVYSMYREGADIKVVETLVQEVDKVLDGTDPTDTTYKQQKYSEACFHETLRIYPSAPRIVRLCVKDDVLPDGTKVYAGEYVTWGPYVMGRSEELWGPDAKQFKPSRWIDNKEKPSQFKFNSFLAGPRICPGQQYATIQSVIIMSMILQAFEIELEEPAKKRDFGTSMGLLMVGGLKIRLSRRFSKDGK